MKQKVLTFPDHKWCVVHESYDERGDFHRNYTIHYATRREARESCAKGYKVAKVSKIVYYYE